MIIITLTMRCLTHPGYTGTRLNRRVKGGTEDWCGACYDIYAIRHPGSDHSDYDAEITIQEVTYA